jgi:UDP-2-acetamido-3-amino-2,3-dideoxy-glucuronate N-acetyltransferase
MTKILLLGLGRWGINHLRNLHALPVELFVAEHESRMLEPARKLGIPESRLTTQAGRFTGQVDGVVVVTPAQTHFPLCREFLEAGRDVFVEKPIALDSEEARKLAELAEKNQRILQVGHIFRFDPASHWLKNAVDAGQFGRLRILRGNMSGFKRPRNDSGIMFADAIHFVDLFNYFLGRPPARVQAMLRDFLGRGMDDAALLSLEYETNEGVVWGVVETNYYLPGKFRELTVIGSELTAACDLNAAGNKITTFANHHVKEGNGFKAVEGAPQTVETKVEEPLRAELQAFVNSISTRKPPLADGWAGYDSVRVLEAAMESARTGGTVAVKD